LHRDEEIPMSVSPEDRTGRDHLIVPSMVEAVVKGLRQLILSGEMRPGDRLVEERLTERFGVSRPPIREALRILQRDGLVQSLPRRGFIVVPLTAADVREIYSLRFALERLAVELGVPVKDSALLVPLRQAMDEMRAAAALHDQDALLVANSSFHYALVALAGHSRLVKAYDALRLQLQLCMAYNLEFRTRLYGDPEDAVRRHESLLELIETGDTTAVMHEVAHHGNQSFLDHLDEIIRPDR
jgi:DNA-binding GntR family transcriptional regulator